jgi:hypothetical protein
VLNPRSSPRQFVRRIFYSRPYGKFLILLAILAEFEHLTFSLEGSPGIIDIPIREIYGTRGAEKRIQIGQNALQSDYTNAGLSRPRIARGMKRAHVAGELDRPVLFIQSHQRYRDRPRIIERHMGARRGGGAARDRPGNR